MDDAEFLNALDLDIGDFDRLTFRHHLLDAFIHQDTSDALHQARERIVPDGGVVSILAFCVTEVNVQKKNVKTEQKTTTNT